MELGKAYVTISADQTKLTAGLNKAKTNVAASMKAIGRNMAIAGAAITAAFGYTVKGAMDFEATMKRVEIQSGATAREMESIKKTALSDVFVQLGKSGSDVANMYNRLASEGYNVAAMKKMLIPISEAVIVLGTEEGETTKLMLNIMQQYNLVAADMGHISDVLAGTLANTSFQGGELVETMKYAGVAASELGWSFAETIPIIDAVIKVTGEASMAGTQFRMMVQKLRDPSEKMRDNLAEVGITLDDVARAIKDPIELIKLLNKAHEAGADFAKIFGVRAGSAAVVISRQSVPAVMELTEKIQETGFAHEAAGGIMETTAGQMGQALAAFQNFRTEIGNFLLPILRDTLLPAMQNILKTVREWVEKNKPLVEAITKWSAGIGVLMLGLGPLLMILPGLVTGISLLLTPIGLVVAAVALAVANFILWYNIIKEIDKILHWHHTSVKDINDAYKIMAEQQQIVAEKFGLTIEKYREYLKLGLSVTEMIIEGSKIVEESAENWKFYNEQMAILTEAAKMGKISARELYGGMKELNEIMALAAKGAEEVDEALYKMAEANKVLQIFMEPIRETIINLTKALTPHEQKIADVEAKYDDMVEAIRMFNVSAENQKAAIEKVNIARELALSKLEKEKTAMDKLIQAKKNFSEVMRGVVDKIYEFTHTEYETKLRLINREYDELIVNAREVYKSEEELNSIIYTINQARSLEIAKLDELTAKEKEDIGAKKLLADSYKTVTDRIFELTHTAMEVHIRKLDQTKQAYIEQGMAVATANQWYDLEIAKLKELYPELDKHAKKLKEATTVTQWLGTQSVIAFDYVKQAIDKARVSLSNFTLEGVAVAIAQIRMHYYPEIVRLFRLIKEAVHIRGLSEWYEADLKAVMKAMASDIATVKYGFEVYNIELGKVPSSYAAVRTAAINATKTMVGSWVMVTNAVNETAEAVSRVSGWVGAVTTPTTTKTEAAIRAAEAATKATAGAESAARAEAAARTKLAAAETEVAKATAAAELEDIAEYAKGRAKVAEEAEAAAKAAEPTGNIAPVGTRLTGKIGGWGQVLGEYVKSATGGWLKSPSVWTGGITLEQALKAAGWDYKFGTPYVPRTGIYKLEKGERVTPAWQNTYDQRKSYSSINIEPGAIQIITPKFDESDAQNIFRLIERQAKMRGLKFAI